MKNTKTNTNTDTNAQLKHTTIIKYNSRQAWRAVIKRSEEYRLDGAGIFRAVGNGAFFFHASYSFDRSMAIEALIDIDAIDFNPAGSYQAVMLSRSEARPCSTIESFDKLR